MSSKTDKKRRVERLEFSPDFIKNAFSFGFLPEPVTLKDLGWLSWATGFIEGVTSSHETLAAGDKHPCVKSLEKIKETLEKSIKNEQPNAGE